MNIRLPYAGARAQRAVIQTGPQGLLLTVCERTPPWALAEIRRQYGELVRPEGKLAANPASTVRVFRAEPCSPRAA